MRERKVRSIPERAKFLGQFFTKLYGNKRWCKSVVVEDIDERNAETSVSRIVTGTTDFLEMCQRMRLKPDDPVLLEIGAVSVASPNRNNPQWQSEMAELTKAMKEMVRERQDNFGYHRPVSTLRQNRKRKFQRISPRG